MRLRQRCLFEQSTKVKISVNHDHELIRLSDTIDWDVLMELAMTIRLSKIKAATGPEPHYRELLGAVALMAIKNITYRDAEDLIAHYAPARYLCDLMDSDWNIDHITIFDFTQTLGEAGMKALNRQILESAVNKGLADPSVLMSDTTAQEGKIPYPNEIGLMSKFLQAVERNTKKAGKKFIKLKKKLKSIKKKVKGLVRTSHLFAKTKEQKRRVAKKLALIVQDIQKQLQENISSGRKLKSKASKELERLNNLMDTLLPQIFYFLKTGFVAKKKIIHLFLDQLYSIVRGKAGKKVEFGLKWGISQIKGGFINGFLVNNGKHVSDKKFCIDAIQEHQETFDQRPRVYGFDRGGYSKGNIKKLKKIGIRQIGVAPKGKTKWEVSKSMRKKITKLRSQVEGAIGTIKSPIYGFNKPNAHKISTLITYGQRAILGFNLKKLIREEMKLSLNQT